MRKFQRVPYTLIQGEGKGIERISSTLERRCVQGQSYQNGTWLLPLSSACKMKPPHSFADSTAVT